MRTFRLATQADVPALAELAIDANQPDAEIPDLVYVAEQDGRIVAAVGIELGHDEAVVLSGGIIHPDYYRNPFLVFRLQEAVEDWLIGQGCTAYICSVSKRNARMQRWIERLGARRYAKEHGAIWYIRTIGNDRNVLEESEAA